MQKNLLDLHPDEINRIMVSRGERSFRINQLLEWIYGKRVLDFSRMTSLPAQLQHDLATAFKLTIPVIKERTGSSDLAVKYLLQLEDDNLIEMVLMPYEGKTTLCLSSQVGCQYKCKFCATGRMGFQRNLTVHEITGQIFIASCELGERKLTNLVLMGMGEPLDNLENILPAINILQHEKCFSFSPRRITLSTCGIVPGIYRLAESGIKLKLALSLNSAVQKKREQIMPVAHRYPLNKLKKSLQYFLERNPYRITLEYVMIRNFNMNREDILALRKFSGDLSCKINLIPWNQVDGSNFTKPLEKDIETFMDALRGMKIAVTLRESRGTDIQAACGQLSARACSRR
ncbi:MAG: 23S rRNA (adenine(2503)-C(2))-methyltransferase RlmN [Candidatus Cloacimonetes bacterium]|nr:23S rRNA (adenine(2503)-C(2))-methyltransferase RlmN [Candidatus Cloacimonadota bacterium]